MGVSKHQGPHNRSQCVMTLVIMEAAKNDPSFWKPLDKVAGKEIRNVCDVCGKQSYLDLRTARISGEPRIPRPESKETLTRALGSTSTTDS